LHSIGRKSRRLINKATEIVANYIDVEPEFIYWTSGASEGNSWVVNSAIKSAQLKYFEVVLTTYYLVI
jgi:cysteine sulfinate desulfinase/cysteine desulfurase-like protein